MKKILQAEVIYDAFMDTILKKLPRKKEDYPDWYKERLEKCEGCKFNTKNVPNSMLPLSLYVSKKIGKNRCSVCTCFIKQKAWSKTEECALGEGLPRPSWMDRQYSIDFYDEKSRWNRLELITMDSDEFNVISTDDKQYNIDLSKDGKSFEIIFEPVEKGNSIRFSFVLESKHDMKITASETSCGCTSSNLNIIDSRHFKFNIEIHTAGFGIGRNTGHHRICPSTEYHHRPRNRYAGPCRSCSLCLSGARLFRIAGRDTAKRIYPEHILCRKRRNSPFPEKRTG